MLVTDTSPAGPNGVVRNTAAARPSSATLSGNIGRLKVLAPSLPDRNKAVRTSPPEQKNSLQKNPDWDTHEKPEFTASEAPESSEAR